MLCRQRLSRAGVGPHGRPVFLPAARRVDGGAGGEDGAVEASWASFSRVGRSL